MDKKKKKFDFKKMKKNAFNSLNDVEYFLHDFKRFSNYIKLYKILKWFCSKINFFKIVINRYVPKRNGP